MITFFVINFLFTIEINFNLCYTITEKTSNEGNIVKKYTLTVTEIASQDIFMEDANTFNLTHALKSAKNGNLELLDNLFGATRIQVCEYGNLSEDSNDQHYINKYSICTPRDNRDLDKENIKQVLSSNREMIEYCVNLHNKYCQASHKKQITVEQIEAVYREMQKELI